MTKAAWAFVANPIGAIIGALALIVLSLKAAFTSSEEGQNKWNKIMLVASTILGNFTDLLADLGEKIIAVFENPQKAIEDFKKLLVENIINRFQGMAELIPKIGEAINLLFKGEFKAAGETALNAVGKVVLGVEDLTDKISGAIDATKEFINQNIKEADAAARVADMRAKADMIERDLLVERAKLESRIAELRLKAREEDQYNAEQRRQFLIDARKLEDGLLDKEKQFLQLRADAQILENTFSRTNKENKTKEAEAIAALSQVEAKRYTNARQIQRELLRIDNEIARDRDALLKELDAAEKEQFNTNKQFLDDVAKEKLVQIKEDYANQIISKEEFLAQSNEVEMSALETMRAFLEANGESVIEIDNRIVEAKIKNREREFEAEKKLADEIDKQEKENLANKRRVTDAGLQLAKEAFGETKELNAAGAAISTYRGAAAALEPPPIGAGPIFGPILAALTIIRGFLQVNKILGLQFERGGIAVGPSHARGGIPFSVGGMTHEMEGGEAIINKRSTQMFRHQLSAINRAGGGREFAVGGEVPISFGNISRQSESISFQRDLFNAISAIRPVVTIEDINDGQERVAVAESRATVI
jgi:hypothetical protein